MLKVNKKNKKWRKIRVRKDYRQIPLQYSQNFLKSPLLVKKLVEQSSIDRTDIVYEIGPGKGIITQELAKKSTKVIAIEKDRGLWTRLREKFLNNPNIEIRLGDFLKERLPEKERYKVFSNIPFSITAEIIAKLTSAANPPKDTYLIIQEESARKFSGSPYGKERLYSLLLQPRFELRILHHFRRTDFYPVPKVNIVLLQIKKRNNPLVQGDKKQLYRDFIVYGFSQWKLNIKKALEKIFTYKQFSRLARDLKFEKSATPSDLSFQQWLGLFNYFVIGVEESKKELVYGSENLLKHQQSRLQKIHRTRKDFSSH